MKDTNLEIVIDWLKDTYDLTTIATFHDCAALHHDPTATIITVVRANHKIHIMSNNLEITIDLEDPKSITKIEQFMQETTICSQNTKPSANT